MAKLCIDVGEVRLAAARLQTMAQLLEKLLRCECPDIDFCGRTIRRSMATEATPSKSRPMLLVHGPIPELTNR